jgi:arabinose-5-phosphate isomerase
VYELSLEGKKMSNIEIGKEVLRAEAEGILEAEKRLGQSFSDAVDCIQNSQASGGKVVVTGMGKSGKIADKVAATLASTGTPAVFLHPAEGLHGDLGLVSPKDVIVIFSNGGNTTEILSMMPSLLKIGVKVIGIIGNHESQLAQKSHFLIDAQVSEEACHNNLAPTTSTTVSLALGDALAMALQRSRDFSPEEFALYHPNGSLGQRLTLKVSDLMHSGDAIPLVRPDSGFEEILLELNKKSMGAVIVGEEEKCMGIITDGDLRRALSHREALFSKCARDLMTKDPSSVEPDLMADDALKIMENRKKQIKELPVINKEGKLVGFLRLHDLLNAGI